MRIKRDGSLRGAARVVVFVGLQLLMPGVSGEEDDSDHRVKWFLD